MNGILSADQTQHIIQHIVLADDIADLLKEFNFMGTKVRCFLELQKFISMTLIRVDVHFFTFEL